jgi:hypothetical protein
MSQTNTSKRQLIIIDSQVNDWQSLANTVSTDSLLLILNSSSDGLTQMSDYLADLSASAGSEGFAPLQSIHIISHGSSGSLLLGSSTLTANNLSIYSSQLASIGHSLTETGDILLYGCDVAQGEMGTQFIQSLAHYTGADVAASDDLTGDAVQGGDWLLENTTGQIEAAIIAQDYSHTLSYTVIDNFNFNYNDAMTSAIFSQAAYCLPSEVPDFLTLVGWEAITPGTTTGWEFENAYAIAGKRVSADDMVQFAIAFEGSNPPLDQLSDWTTTNASEYGWSQYYANLMPLMTLVVREAMLAKDENKNVELLITGHSLGGAAASVAYADLFLPSNQDFWIETKDDVPLKNGHRIYDQTGLDQWTDAQIRALLTDTNVYTFGAPSFLIEPTKPSGSEWLALGFDLVTSSNPADFFFTLGAAVAEAVIVDDTLIRDLSGYWEHVFQFEHENSDWAAFVDPVASIGSEDAGTVLDINLTTSIYDRYNEIASFPEMHSMDNYVESIARLISGAELIKSDNPLSSNSLC